MTIAGPRRRSSTISRPGRPRRLAPATHPRPSPTGLTEAASPSPRTNEGDRIPAPCPRRKTPAEIAGAREAQLRDGAAMARIPHGSTKTAPKGALTEIDVVRAPRGFPRDTGALRDNQLRQTSAGRAEHGAMSILTGVTEATNRAVRPGELLLVDSGGKYMDGTTDIKTRTNRQSASPGRGGADPAYTLVLKGRSPSPAPPSPRGVAGRDLDAIWRGWRSGCGAATTTTGTGHGVGAYPGRPRGPPGPVPPLPWCARAGP